MFLILKEVPGMGFHITQPGSSVATSLIDGESKPKHVLLLEIKVANRIKHIFFSYLEYSVCAPIHYHYFTAVYREINIAQPKYL